MEKVIEEKGRKRLVEAVTSAIRQGQEHTDETQMRPIKTMPLMKGKLLEGRYSGISEFVSRQARRSLVELCIDAIEKAKEAQKDRTITAQRTGAALELAKMMKVTKRTVHHWLQDTYQSDNINVKLLLSVALNLNPNGVDEILREDYKRHRQELANLGILVQERD